MKTTKRQVSLFLALLLAVSAFTAGFSQAFAAPGLFSGGSGTPIDPYVITTPEELDQVRDYLDSCFILGNDIDLTAYLAGSEEGWEPIGEDWYGSSFTGVFDGDNYKIISLWINRPDEYSVGLFGYAKGATIENLGVEITSTGIAGGKIAGGLVGQQVGGTITNCFVTGDVKASYSGGDNAYASGGYAGGLIGWIGLESGGGGGEAQNDGYILNITNCYTTGNIEASYSGVYNGYAFGGYAGGLIGRIGGNGAIMPKNNVIANIADCHATGNVVGMGVAGGLVGYQANPWEWDGVSQSITNCYATGDVMTSDDYSDAGGLVGEWNGDSITDCYATGDVSGYFAGGLVGARNRWYSSYEEPNVGSSITGCYATGDVFGRRSAGGLMGDWRDGREPRGNITDCYATGDVTVDIYFEEYDEHGGGGLVGLMNGLDITNCYAMGDVAGNNSIGGLVGLQHKSSIINCYAMGNVSGDNCINGIVGYQSDTPTISNTYRYIDMKINGETSAVDTPDDVMGGIKTALELRTRATYEGNGWDFDAVWRMVPGFDYPQLRGETGPEPLIYGDVDGDGVMDMIDAILLSRYVAEWDGITIDLLAADLNGDGVVDMLDSIIMTRHIAEWPGYEVLPLKA